MAGHDSTAHGDFLDMHGAGLDLRHPGVGDPFDVALAHFAFQQALGVADPVQAEVADIGLGGDEGHRYPVAHLATPEFGVEDQGEFVSGAKA